MPGWTERLRIRFESPVGNFRLRSFTSHYGGLVGVVSAQRAAPERFRIEFVDVGEHFAEGAGAVLEQDFAFLRGGQRGIAGGAARVKVLGLPCERRRPVRGEP